MVANASSIALVPFEVEEVLQTVYTIERYPTFYDTATCLAENVTYTNRVDQPDSFGFCSVPLSAADTFLFASVALLLAGLLANKLSAVWLLLAGGAVGVLNHYVNLGRVSNAIALWLHISPPYLFWYAFLPPLLVDAAMRLDFYTFGKLWVNVVLLAFPLVILSVVTLAPFVLFALGFQGRGWDWVHGALLAAVLAPTDAVSVTAILKAGGGPEFMSVLMEGEALLNDASAITMYEIFFRIIEEFGASPPDVWSQLPHMLLTIVRLAGVGTCIGLVAGLLTMPLLRWMRWRGLPAVAEVCFTLGMSYLAFYVAQGPLTASGVFAVVTYGIYSSATSRFGMLSNDAASAVHETVWDTVAFVANGLVFFWSGISSVNLIIRSTGVLHTGWSYGAIPLIFIFSFVQRGACILLFNPLHKMTHVGEELTWQQMVFATVGGLRGSLSLIMISSLAVHQTTKEEAEVNADILLWTSCFVLITLVANAPALGPLMVWLGLTRVTDDQEKDKRYALRGLRAHTREAAVRLQDQPDEFLVGADWGAAVAFVQRPRSDPRHTAPSAAPVRLSAAGLRQLSSLARSSMAAFARKPAAEGGGEPAEDDDKLEAGEAAPAAPGGGGGGGTAPAAPALLARDNSASDLSVSMDFPTLEDLMDEEEGVHGAAFLQALQAKADAHAAAAARAHDPQEDASDDEEGLQPRVDRPLPHLRLRVVHTLERYCASKRLQGLLSPQALQAVHFACERAAERLEEHPGEALDLWDFVDREVEETRVGRALAWAARGLGRVWAPLARPLRRRLAGRRLLSCEVALEVYMGLACSKHMEWLYASDEGSLAALRAEVRASLDQARAFIALREAEAPGEWIAVQTFRAAQALLQVQADFVRKQHGRGLLTDGDLEELLEGINAKRTRLEVVGPMWTLPKDAKAC